LTLHDSDLLAGACICARVIATRQKSACEADTN
jgi:hypothetical protein